MGIPGEEREKRKEEIFETMMTGNFFQINARCQSTHVKEAHAKQDKSQKKKKKSRHLIFKLKKTKRKKKPWKKHMETTANGIEITACSHAKISK